MNLFYFQQIETPRIMNGPEDAIEIYRQDRKVIGKYLGEGTSHNGGAKLLPHLNVYRCYKPDPWKTLPIKGGFRFNRISKIAQNSIKHLNYGCIGNSRTLQKLYHRFLAENPETRTASARPDGGRGGDFRFPGPQRRRQDHNIEAADGHHLPHSGLRADSGPSLSRPRSAAADRLSARTALLLRLPERRGTARLLRRVVGAFKGGTAQPHPRPAGTRRAGRYRPAAVAQVLQGHAAAGRHCSGHSPRSENCL